MKSKEMLSQCLFGMGSGCKGPEGWKLMICYGGILCMKVYTPLPDLFACPAKSMIAEYSHKI